MGAFPTLDLKLSKIQNILGTYRMIPVGKSTHDLRLHTEVKMEGLLKIQHWLSLRREYEVCKNHRLRR